MLSGTRTDRAVFLPRWREWFRTRLTPERLTFYLGVLLLTYAGLFVYREATPGVLDRHDRVRGLDFLNFYLGGRILALGEVDRLYDHTYFLQLQETLASVNDRRPPYYPLYPPTTSLAFTGLACLPYEQALLLWWLIQATCFSVAVAWLLRDLRPDPAWRRPALLALLAFTPVYATFVNGQLAAVLLLALLGGLRLYRSGRPFLAGGVLALLTWKPQFALGPGLWMLLRGDRRLLAGFATGLLAQVGVTAAVLGPDVFLRFVENVPFYARLSQVFHFTPDHQHSLSGILSNLLGPSHDGVCKLVHALAAVGAVLLLRQVVNAQRRSAEEPEGPDLARLEDAAVVLCTLAVTPHLLTYDLALLLIPMARLWAPGTDGKRTPEMVELGVVLFLAGTATFLYHFTGFSLVPAALLGGLFCLGRLARRGLAPRTLPGPSPLSPAA